MAKCSIDYAFKSYVLNEHSELLLLHKRCSLFDYQLEQHGYINEYIKNVNNGLCSMYDLYNYCLDNNLMKEFYEVIKINYATYKRDSRLRSRVETMLLNGSCLFLTLTFSDNALNTTTAKQRRVAVCRFCKKYNCMYVANIDFGKDETKTMREHYHVLINCDKVNCDDWKEYGSIDFERVRNRNIESDKKRLSKYIAKLSNHAIKETTKRSSLIYSR